MTTTEPQTYSHPVEKYFQVMFNHFCYFCLEKTNSSLFNWPSTNWRNYSEIWGIQTY